VSALNSGLLRELQAAIGSIAISQASARVDQTLVEVQRPGTCVRNARRQKLSAKHGLF